MRRLPRVFLFCLPLLSPLPALADNAAATQWWADVSALANDGMEGRLAGSPGYDRAADYVISRLKAEGLAPAGINGKNRCAAQHGRAHAWSPSALHPSSRPRANRNSRSRHRPTSETVITATYMSAVCRVR